MIRVVCGLAFDGEGRILMTRRRPDVPRPDMWEHPGGKVEPGETDAAALAREWQEELGVPCTVVRRVAHTNFYFEVPFKITLYRVMMPPGAVPRPIVAADLQWFDPEWAVVRLAGMVPSAYVFHPHVVACRRSS